MGFTTDCRAPPFTVGAIRAVRLGLAATEPRRGPRKSLQLLKGLSTQGRKPDSPPLRSRCGPLSAGERGQATESTGRHTSVRMGVWLFCQGQRPGYLHPAPLPPLQTHCSPGMDGAITLSARGSWGPQGLGWDGGDHSCLHGGGQSRGTPSSRAHSPGHLAAPLHTPEGPPASSSTSQQKAQAQQ